MTFVGIGIGMFPSQSGGGGTPVVPVSPLTVDLPAGASSFWSLMQSTGYAGKSIRIQRSSDSTETDIGFDANKMVDQNAILAFAGAGTAYVSKVYAQVGSVDMVQATQSLMPIIAQSGAVIKTAAGIPAMRCSGGRYLAAAGSFTPMAGLDFSVSFLAQNDNAQGTSSTTLYTPVVGATSATPSNSARWHFLFGQRSAFTRSMMWEMASSAQASNEVTGWQATLSASTTGLVTTNCQSANLTGGPNVGSTLYYNRAKQDDGTTSGTVDNTLHSPAALTTVADIRIGAFANSGWQTNTANGSSCAVVSVYLGAALTDAQRQAFEQQIIDKCSAILKQSLSLPSLGTTGEAWNFATYAANKVTGVKGNADLNMQTAANGSAFTLTTAPISGLSGVYEAVTNNFQNDFEATNTLGWNERSFTMWALVTIDDTPAARIFDFIVHGVGTLGTTSARYISSGLSKDHSPLCAYALDVSTAPGSTSSDYTNMMVGGDAVTGATAWMQYSPFMGGGFMGVNVPGHDFNSDHPPFYTKKHFLRGMGTAGSTDNVQYLWARNKTILMLMKHQPHPNYDFAKAYDDPANVPWRNKATTIVKVAEIGGLDGFDKVPGARVDHINRSATVVNSSASRIRHYGGENLNTFKGWTHALGFVPKFTSDTEDQALFYTLTNPTANIAALASA